MAYEAAPSTTTSITTSAYSTELEEFATVAEYYAAYPEYMDQTDILLYPSLDPTLSDADLQALKVTTAGLLEALRV